jgi:hypothetical protein
MSQPIAPRPSRRLFGSPSPLRRAGDRVEVASRLLCVLVVLLAVPVALTAATVAGTGARQRADDEAATRTEVPAVLLADAVASTGAEAAADRVRTPGTWHAPDGSRREGLVPATVGAGAGQTVRIWVDGDGERVRPPLDTAGVVSAAVGTGMMVFLVLAALGLSGHLLVCRALERHRAHQWDDAWAAVEPRWSGRC